MLGGGGGGRWGRCRTKEAVEPINQLQNSGENLSPSRDTAAGRSTKPQSHLMECGGEPVGLVPPTDNNSLLDQNGEGEEEPGRRKTSANSVTLL